MASKRAQVAHAAPQVVTPIAVMMDDHVFWRPGFLKAILCPFEDPNVGLVGTNKRVQRLDGLGLWARIWNMLGALYLCRHNFEIRATNAVDGGVFVVSGRTYAIRTEILDTPTFSQDTRMRDSSLTYLGPLVPTMTTTTHALLFATAGRSRSNTPLRPRWRRYLASRE